MKKATKSNLPRVLVIGQRFHRNGGGGITLTNLFAEWDKEKLFSLPLQTGVSDTSICTNVFEVNHLNRRYFGFIRWNKLSKRSNNIPGYQCNSNNTDELRNINPPMSLIYKLREKADRIFKLIGVIHIKNIYCFDPSLKQWLDQVDADVIYAQYSTLASILFIMKIVKFMRKPLVVHIMDDWISTLSQESKWSLFANVAINKYFKMILAMASMRIAISEAMGNEYKRRYHMEFRYLNNPVEEASVQLSIACKDFKTDGLNIAYFGRIGRANQGVISFICNALEGSKHRLSVYSPDLIHNNGIKLNNTNSYGYINHSEVFSVMQQHDLLLLPFDFNSDSILFAKYSMPTKIGEYMMSGVPILLVSPRHIAVEDYLRKRNAAFILNFMDISDLLELLDDSCSNPNDRQIVSEQALKHANDDFSRRVIIDRFVDIMNTASGYHSS